MANMTHTWTDAKTGTITILDGPAAGSYAFRVSSTVENGIMNLGPITIDTPGRIVQLKIDLAKNLPGLAEEIATRKAASLATAHAAHAKRATKNAVDVQMAKAGFSTGSVVLDKEYGYRGE